MDALDLTGEEILAIQPTRAGLLFSGHNAGDVYRNLAKRWHPDRPKGDAQVFQHIHSLHKEMQGRRLVFRAKSGKMHELLFRRRHKFELGEVFVGINIVAFYVEKKYEDLMLRGIRQMNSIRYPDDDMQRDLSRFFPREEGMVEIDDTHLEGFMLIVKKTADVVMLHHLIDHLGGAVDPKHVAWIMSSLLNLACFMSITGLVHNGLTTDSVFVSPKHHAAFMLGGWWYAARAGATIAMLPPAVHAVAPEKALKTKTADPRTDLESIRAIGRACIGSHSAISALPRPYANFLRLPAAESAIDDYTKWQQVLLDSYGKRRFLELALTSADLYP